MENLRTVSVPNILDKNKNYRDEIKKVRSFVQNRSSKILVFGSMLLMGQTSCVAEDQQVHENEGPVNELGVIDARPVDDIKPEIAEEKGCNVVRIDYAGGIQDATTVPLNATNIPLLCVDIHQGCEDGTIQVMKFIKNGAVNLDGIEVYIGDQFGARRTDVTVGNSINFKNIDKSLAANSTNRLCLFGHVLKAKPGEVYSYSLMPAEESNITNKPGILDPQVFKGGTFSIAEDNVPYVFAKPDMVTTDILPNERSVIASFTIGNEVHNDPVKISRLTLKVGGSCNHKSIRNLALVNNSTMEEVANANHLEKGKLVHFNIAVPSTLLAGEEISYSVIADQECKENQTIDVYVEEPGDFFIKDDSGFGVYPYGYDGTSAIGNYSSVTAKSK
jgi:hypothetical protein